jgi:hypothetical protein
MIELEVDGSGFTHAAMDMGIAVDQIPYAMARTLNDAAEKTRSWLIYATWPTAVQVRNQSFMNASLSIKGARASKDNLEVTIYDRLGRASLPLHAKGGVKMPNTSALAIPPTGAVNRGPRGVPPSQRPRNLANSFRKGNAIYQRVGKGKRARLRLMYFLKPMARIKKDVPFYEDFAKKMVEEMQANLARNVALAMKTRRR